MALPSKPTCMENPATDNGQNGGGIAEVIQYFGSFKLGKDGNLKASQTSINAAAIPTPQEHALAHIKKIKNQCDVVQESTDGLSEKPVLDHNTTIWVPDSYSTPGHEFWQNQGQGSFRGLQDYKDYNYVDSLSGGLQDYKDYKDYNYVDNLCKPDFLGYGTSSILPRMDSFCGYPSTSNYVKSNPIFPKDSSFRPASLYNYENYQSREVRNNGVDYVPSYSSRNHHGIKTFAEAVALMDLSLLHEILDGGDRVEIDMLLMTFRGSYFYLMTDRALFDVFQKLVDSCKDDQLDSVAAEVLSCPPLFIKAAFCKQGSSSIIRLISRLKKSSNSLNMTRVLSKQFLALMTDDIGRMVIQTCFNYFPNKHNKVLYEKAISHCKELATDKVGCRALYDVISTIAGEQRSRLLNQIADCSAYLSYNIYGNYVVQNVLMHKADGVSGGIVSRLRGECVELAKHQGGSHVVEKCIEASDYGMVSVVQEIVETPKASLQLAQHQFGNYVIQAALKNTKERGFTDLYKSLVKSIMSHFKELSQTMYGKIVLALIKDDDFQLKWRSRSFTYGKEQWSSNAAADEC